MNQTNWLDTAVSGIRFKPDRRAVRAELEGHIEDKKADLRRIFPDIPAEEAADRALAAMGDPEELKVSLAKVHRPWLGWLWRLSQAALAAAVCLLLTSGILVDIWNIRDSEDPGTDRQGIVALEPDGTRVRTDGYTIAMTKAYRWTHTYPEGETETRLSVTLRRSSPMFWCRDSDYSSSWNTFLTGEDSAGNYYPSYQERWNEPEYRMGLWEFVWPNWREDGLFRTDCELMIPLKDPDAEWLRLNYDWMGRRFSFTVHLKEVGA